MPSRLCFLWVSGPEYDPSEAESVSQSSLAVGVSRDYPADLMVLELTS